MSWDFLGKGQAVRIVRPIGGVEAETNNLVGTLGTIVDTDICGEDDDNPLYNVKCVDGQKWWCDKLDIEAYKGPVQGKSYRLWDKVILTRPCTGAVAATAHLVGKVATIEDILGLDNALYMVNFPGESRNWCVGEDDIEKAS